MIIVRHEVASRSCSHFLCHERVCNLNTMLYLRWRKTLRSRLAGAGFKQPEAASVGNAAVVNVTVKRRDQTRHVWIKETNESEPLTTHR